MNSAKNGKQEFVSCFALCKHGDWMNSVVVGKNLLRRCLLQILQICYSVGISICAFMPAYVYDTLSYCTVSGNKLVSKVSPKSVHTHSVNVQ